MSGTVLIRPAVPDDAKALTALAFRSKAHWGYDAAFMAACRDELTVTRGRITDEHYLVAETAGTVIGMAGLARDPDGWEVCNMFIAPEQIGTGLGGRLFRALTRLAKKLGIEQLAIDADPNARGFYEHMGAVFQHLTPSGSIPGRTIPHLKLTL